VIKILLLLLFCAGCAREDKWQLERAQAAPLPIGFAPQQRVAVADAIPTPPVALPKRVLWDYPYTNVVTFNVYGSQDVAAVTSTLLTNVTETTVILWLTNQLFFVTVDRISIQRIR